MTKKILYILALLMVSTAFRCGGLSLNYCSQPSAF